MTWSDVETAAVVLLVALLGWVTRYALPLLSLAAEVKRAELAKRAAQAGVAAAEEKSRTSDRPLRGSQKREVAMEVARSVAPKIDAAKIEQAIPMALQEARASMPTLGIQSIAPVDLVHPSLPRPAELPEDRPTTATPRPPLRPR